MIRKKINNTRFIINIGDVTKSENSDVLIVWTTNNLIAGDETFIKIHKEAGSIIRRQCEDLLTEYGNSDTMGQFSFPVTKVAITSAGKLTQYYHFLHCILPNYRNEDEKLARNGLIRQTLKNAFDYLDLFSEKQVLITKVVLPPFPPKLCGEITTSDLKEIFICLIEQTKKLREVKIICTTDEEYEAYSKAFLMVTVPFWERWFIKLFKTTY